MISKVPRDARKVACKLRLGELLQAGRQLDAGHQRATAARGEEEAARGTLVQRRRWLPGFPPKKIKQILKQSLQDAH